MSLELKNISSVRYKRSLFSIEDVFLSDAKGNEASVNYYIQVPTNTTQKLNDFYTLLIDLNASKEKIREGIYHRTQDEINSFLNNNVFEYSCLLPLKDDVLEEFIQHFNSFARSKQIRTAEKERLLAYNEAGILAVTFLKLDGVILCVNFYRITQTRAANIHSFTMQHINTKNISGSLYGKAHRALHWLDMMKFKENNIPTYDLCGWYEGTTDQALLNINKFKEQFGGVKVKEFSGYIIHNPLLKLFKR